MKRNIIIIISIVVALLLILALIAYYRFGSGRYINISGTVTKYDITPTYVDGNAIFEIDSKSVDIGGGLEAGVRGEFDQQIKMGDKVTARLIVVNGRLTTSGCPECYVVKQN